MGEQWERSTTTIKGMKKREISGNFLPLNNKYILRIIVAGVQTVQFFQNIFFSH